MDDYDVSSLSESKNEWGARLVNIVTPSVMEGMKSIFAEADKLCRENDEEEKYLMTFQNLLARVAKWNSSIIEEETQRIIKTSQCEYLEDLVTCVHIVHLKALTSIRVSSKQKKVDVDVPKVSDFIHRIYVAVARNVYKNVYLFEKNIAPLQYQKNMRELEVIVKECVLNTVRESIPVAQILRAYIDETVEEEEVVEENVEIIQPTKEDDEENEKEGENNETPDAKGEIVKSTDSSSELSGGIVKKEDTSLSSSATVSEETPKPEISVVKPDTEVTTKKLTDSAEQLQQAAEKLNESAEVLNVNTVVSAPAPAPAVEVVQPPIVKEPVPETTTLTSIEPAVNTEALVANTSKIVKAAEETATQSALSFNNTDSVLDMGTNQSADIEAPKTIERLEQISEQRNQERKLEEMEEEDEDDGVLKIHSDPINLDTLEIQDVSSKLKITDDPVLGDIEVLS